MGEPGRGCRGEPTAAPAVIEFQTPSLTHSSTPPSSRPPAHPWLLFPTSPALLAPCPRDPCAHHPRSVPCARPRGKTGNGIMECQHGPGIPRAGTPPSIPGRSKPGLAWEPHGRSPSCPVGVRRAWKGMGMLVLQGTAGLPLLPPYSCRARLFPVPFSRSRGADSRFSRRVPCSLITL